MESRDPRMLPGPTAFTLNRVITVLAVIALAALGLAFAGAIVAKFIGSLLSHWSGAWAYVDVLFALIGVFVVCLIVGIPVGRRLNAVRDAELEAGYTTLLKEFNQVDGIDPATGQVVRPAKVRPPGSPALDAITTAMDVPPVEGLGTPGQVFARSRGFFVATVATVALLVACTIILFGSANNDDFGDLQAAALLIGVCDLVAVLMLLILGLIRISILYARALARALPDSRVYGGNPENPDGLEELLGPDAPALPNAKPRYSDYLAFDDTHLVMYSRYRDTMLPFLAIPRSRIASATLGSIPQAQAPSLPSPVLTITKDNGTTTDLTIALARLSLNSTSRDLRPIAAWIIEWASAEHS